MFWRNLKKGKIASLLAIMLTLLLLTTQVTKASPLASGTWRVVPSPSPGAGGNFLASVATVSANNIWAVGIDVNSNGVQQSLIEHWNGTRWKVVPSPNPGAGDNFLHSVAAVSANNIWAVGFYTNAGGVAQTLVDHWNGTKWSVVSSPSPGTASNSLRALAVVIANNIWAVGFFTNAGGVKQTLVEHWNGTKWKVVPSPNLGTDDNFLSSVAAVSANNIWAVGFHMHTGIAGQPIIEHWNGSVWSIVNGPNPGSGAPLYAVAAVSANNIWAVGQYSALINGSYINQTLVEHWNGSVWTVLSTPSPGTADNSFEGVAAVSASSIWAVGGYQNTGGIEQTLTETSG